ncbi:3-hydroxyisobutyryl-CoA hydrolase [Crepidotus variabilis]|uniref:3-hydroxyisobutyryl-CoA hydrolase n=1 Tax=Crepidotus variabilis TaxID=179855 RepID=A0A9P6EDP4_9AGAR|nr:3-hydroxyisobutyryl-CoA hydrolase [Crepidotus variabilis]
MVVHCRVARQGLRLLKVAWSWTPFPPKHRPATAILGLAFSGYTTRKHKTWVSLCQMFSPLLRNSMTRSAARTAAQRAGAIRRHIMSTSSAAQAEESTVKFESTGSLRTYVLNRPAKLNALDESMLSILRPKIEEWNRSELCGTIVGRGEGRAFCAGGDVASVVENTKNPQTVPAAVDYFKREFEMDYILAATKKPYVAIMDGFTMGGGVGLAANAPFRVATEKTRLAMPETKIGYFPDVGASFFLSHMDGETGTYLALTSERLSGRAVFEHGFATHYIPSRRIPMLLDRLAELDKPHPSVIDRTIEDLSAEREPGEPSPPFVGSVRVALDYAFRHNNVEMIMADLRALTEASEDANVKAWALTTLETLQTRSPTSLKVALEAVRRGKKMTLLQALEMELKIATAFCRGASPDFVTGVEAVLLAKSKETPQWSPSSLKEVTPAIVSRFFDSKSTYLEGAPTITIPDGLDPKEKTNPMRYALPTENEIGAVVRGQHPSGGDMGLQLNELLTRFAELRPGKMGVKEKVLEVVERRCELVDNADQNRVWLKWKH